MATIKKKWNPHGGHAVKGNLHGEYGDFLSN